YYALLHWSYTNLIVPRWSYRGFVNDLSPEGFYISLIGVVFTIFTFIVFDRRDTPSSIVMNLFNLLFYIPLYVYIAYIDVVGEFFIFSLLYQLALFVCYIFLPVNFKPVLPRSKRHFIFIVGFVLVSTLFINGFYNGFKIKIDLTDVYENRLAVRDMNIPSIFNYIKAAAYLVGVVALMYALKKRNWVLVGFVILIQLMSFAFGASKTQFFTIFVSLIAFFGYSDKLRLWAPVSLLLVIIISIAEYKIFETTGISDVWTRRSLFVPAQISYNMY